MKISKMHYLCLNWLAAGALLAVPAVAKTAAHKAAAHKPSVPKPALVASGPAVDVVQQYLDARQAEEEEKAYALLSPDTQAEFPVSRREQMAQSLTDPNMANVAPPALLPVIALFADIHNTLHFKFRVLGLSPDDPSVVLVRAYQTGKPLSTIKILKVVTVPDPIVPNALRLDGLKTATTAAPEEMQGKIQAATKSFQAASQYNLKQLARGVLQYAQDHEEKLPDADQWATEITPYVKSEAFFRDPAAPADEKWSYAFNRNLSGVALSEVEDSAKTVLLFESDSGKKNAADTGDTVPLPGRHDGGTDYAFVDGRVQWQADHVAVSYSLHGN